MQTEELLAIEELAKSDPQVNELWEKHTTLKKIVQKLEAKAYHSPQDEMDLKIYKKEKLEVKTLLLKLVEAKAEI